MTEGFWSLFLESFIENLPQFLGAVLVFLIGFFISKLIGNMAHQFLKQARLNHALKRLGWKEALAKTGFRFDASKFFGELVRWFFIIFFLMAASEIVGLPQLSQFLGGVIAYFKNIFVASLIFIIAVFLCFLLYFGFEGFANYNLLGAADILISNLTISLTLVLLPLPKLNTSPSIPSVSAALIVPSTQSLM